MSNGIWKGSLPMFRDILRKLELEYDVGEHNMEVKRLLHTAKDAMRAAVIRLQDRLDKEEANEGDKGNMSSS